MSFHISNLISPALGISANPVPLLVSLAVYVLTALAYYAMAQKRNIRHPWLAWVPVGNIWLLGSLSDQYQYVVKGRVRSRRKVLLTLNIMTGIFTAGLFSVFLGSFVSAIGYAVKGAGEEQFMEKLFEILLYTGGAALVFLPVIIVKKIFEYMALYDVFQSCDPQNAAMYLTMSILFVVTRPLFLFVLREKELGMPQRKPCSSAQTAEPLSSRPAEDRDDSEPPAPEYL